MTVFLAELLQGYWRDIVHLCLLGLLNSFARKIPIISHKAQWETLPQRQFSPFPSRKDRSTRGHRKSVLFVLQSSQRCQQLQPYPTRCCSQELWDFICFWGRTAYEIEMLEYYPWFNCGEFPLLKVSYPVLHAGRLWQNLDVNPDFLKCLGTSIQKSQSGIDLSHVVFYKQRSLDSEWTEHTFALQDWGGVWKF